MSYKEYIPELSYKYDISLLCNSPQKLDGVLTSLPAHQSNNKFAYGTAGFRANGDLLLTVSHRIAIVAALRSLCFPGHRAIGLMVTASHNPAADNGFKIVDPHGGMLNIKWETIATNLTNATPEQLPQLVQNVLKTYVPEANHQTFAQFFTSSSISNQISITDPKDVHWDVFNQYPNRPIILIGYDNRPSSIKIVDNIKSVCLSLGCVVVNYHLCSTPQLHWFVGKFNDLDTRLCDKLSLVESNPTSTTSSPCVPFPTYNSDPNAFPTHAMYTSTIVQSFLPLYQFFYSSSPLSNLPLPSRHYIPQPCIPTTASSPRVGPTKEHLFVDVAHGVGYCAFFPVIQCLNDTTAIHPQITTILNPGAHPQITTISNPGHNEVNDCAGIDYALKGNQLKDPIPSILTDAVDPPENRSLWSVDGDCDRAGGILLLPNSESASHPSHAFLDGDRLLVLFVTFFMTLVHTTHNLHDVTIAAVQTAYSNGASAKYLKDTYGNDLTLLKACTGVKHLLEKTTDHDICVYFEQNGHGSVCFNLSLYDKLDKKIAAACDDEDLKNKLVELRSIIFLSQQLITPYIGDACGDILFAIICMLQSKQSMLQVYQTYENFYTRATVVKVLDKSIIVPNADLAEEFLISPYELQEEIDSLVQKHAQYNLRCFVRPSGTEDVVRICVESSKLSITQEILNHMKSVVEKYAGKAQDQSLSH